MQYNERMHELGKWDSPLIQQHFQCSSVLGPYIKSYQLLTGQHNFNGERNWYLLPDNSSYLVFHLYERNGKSWPSLKIVGPRSRHKLINRASRSFTLIVSLKPGALYQLCQLPVSELTDQALDASTLLPEFDDEVLQGLGKKAQCLAIQPLISELEQLLFDRLSDKNTSSGFIRAFQQIDLTPMIKVSEMADQLGISSRHLRSLTQKHIGHGPKTLLQIERFTRSLQLSNKNRQWTDLALEAGYYDQSHLIAAYQRMIGISPDKLFPG